MTRFKKKKQRNEPWKKNIGKGEQGKLNPTQLIIH